MSLAEEFYYGKNVPKNSNVIQQGKPESTKEEKTIIISDGCPKELRDFVAENREKDLRVQHSDGTFSEGFRITGKPKRDNEEKWSVELRGIKDGQPYEVTIPIEELINTQELN